MEGHFSTLEEGINKLDPKERSPIGKNGPPFGKSLKTPLAKNNKKNNFPKTSRIIIAPLSQLEEVGSY